MSSEQFVRDRLAHVVEHGGVLKLTGPRSVSNPGPGASEQAAVPPVVPKRRRGVVRPFVVRTFINGGSDWYDDAAFYYRHDAVWWAENMADDPERSSVVDVRYDDN